MFSYVADVMAIDGDIYALCASDVSGELYRLDPENGAIKAHATVGANPTELAGLDDGRILVVNAADNTLSLVTPDGGTLTSRTSSPSQARPPRSRTFVPSATSSSP